MQSKMSLSENIGRDNNRLWVRLYLYSGKIQIDNYLERKSRPKHPVICPSYGRVDKNRNLQSLLLI